MIILQNSGKRNENNVTLLIKILLLNKFSKIFISFVIYFLHYGKPSLDDLLSHDTEPDYALSETRDKT